MKRRLVWLLILIAALLGAGYGYTAYRSSAATPTQESRFRFAKVVRGDLRATVTATGELQPVTLVQVGSQVSGTIKALSADFNTKVTKGMVLAQLDPAPRQAQADQSRARLAGAQATLIKREAEITVIEANLENARADARGARASLAKVKIDLEDTQREARRYEQLYRDGIISASQRDSKIVASDSAKVQDEGEAAKLAGADARAKSLQNQLQVARAERSLVLADIKAAQAELRLNETNLSYTTIASPIDGIVISRNVDVGQTVAATFQAPVLFTIAQDLTTMQVRARVDEADVGVIKVGNQATFKVDAFPNEVFSGRVHEIRNAAAIVQNVVTYETIIDVANREGKLRPGMTATVTVVVADQQGVLKVPTEALAFIPPVLRRGGPAAERFKEAMARFPERFRDPKVWVYDGVRQRPSPMPITTGFADETMTELRGDGLKEGAEVIVGVEAPAGAAPFGQNRLNQFGRRLGSR
ncbi:MAG: efflux RND transporter periplasmic adaptor subunit [Candidatus Tectomicrobia bacterium]|nr:efflux RND transporter periplasmic adaptor subunit [Candidatus Tectomicrobia bacterium]